MSWHQHIPVGTNTKLSWTLVLDATGATRTFYALMTDASGRLIIGPPTTIGTLADVVAAAAATQLTVTSTACVAVAVKALALNVGTVRVGDANVGASRGIPLAAGESVTLDTNDVSNVYIFGNGLDSVAVMYVN